MDIFLPPPRAGEVPSGSEAEATARYLATQGRLTEAGLRLVALGLDARGALTLRLERSRRISVNNGEAKTAELLLVLQQKAW